MQMDDKEILENTSVLFVDDNLVVRKEIGRFLKNRVGTHYLADDGRMGLESFKKFKPDIVLSDLQMPDMDGLEMALAIKEIDPNVPVILMTAYDDKKYLLKALDIGIDGYIVKPVNYDILARSIFKNARELYHQQEILRLNKLLNEKIISLNEKTVYLDNILLYSIEMAIVATDSDLNIKYFNPLAKESLSFTSDKIIGENFSDLFTDGQVEYKKLLDAVKEVRKRGQFSQILEIANDQGAKLLETQVSEIRDKESQLVGFVFMLRDVTDQRKMEDELNRMQRLESVGVMAGGLAHDFNNLMTTILGNIGLSKLYVTEGDDIFRNLTEAEKACGQARNLTDRFLTFSRGGTPYFKSFRVQDFLPDYVNLALSGTNISSTFLLSDDLWKVEVDEGQMSQVIQNIVINSLESMPNGGKLKVQAENTQIDQNQFVSLKTGQYVKISIIDEGKGITKENLSRIFDPYFSTKESGTQKGMGLGLSICYSIIKKHKGYITAESIPGKGTTILIYLPVYNEEINDGVKRKETKGKCRILLMDDDQMVTDVASRMLSHLGYDPVTAKDGEETIELYETARETGKPFQIVILDLTIRGGLGGQETIIKLLEIDPQVKALVSSGYSSDPILANYQEYGFIGIVKKPYKIKELDDTIQKVL